jgi:hypothetical protein
LFPSPENPSVSLFPEHEPPAPPLQAPAPPLQSAEAGVVPPPEGGAVGGVAGGGINITFRRSSM